MIENKITIYLPEILTPIAQIKSMKPALNRSGFLLTNTQILLTRSLLL